MSRRMFCARDDVVYLEGEESARVPGILRPATLSRSAPLATATSPLPLKQCSKGYGRLCGSYKHKITVYRKTKVKRCRQTSSLFHRASAKTSRTRYVPSATVSTFVCSSPNNFATSFSFPSESSCWGLSLHRRVPRRTKRNKKILSANRDVD